MLSPADRELALRDSQLPGLATLFDPADLLSKLREALPDVALERLRPTYTRYKPQTNCLSAYQLDWEQGTLPIYAKTYAHTSGAKVTKPRVSRGASSVLGPAQLVLTDPDLAVFVFPYDARLEVLNRIADPTALEKMLKKVAADHPELWGGSVQLLRYKPERRFVGRLTSPDGSMAALRFYAPDQFVSSSVASKKLESRSTLRLARRLGAWKRRHVLAIEWVEGRPLGGELSHVDARFDAFERVGTALAELHGQWVGSLPRLRVEQEASRLWEIVKLVSFLCPQLSDRLRAVVDRVAAALADRPATRGTLHGDFYAGQVLLSDDQVVLLDLDRATQGDPSADLGNFLGHLERDVACGLVCRSHASEAAAGLLEGYQRTTGASASGVSAHTAAALLRLCSEPFRYREPDWPERVEELMDAAELQLHAEPSPPVRVAVPSGQAAPASDDMPGFDVATDPERAAPLLEELLASKFGKGNCLVLTRLRVVRHKPGRRCLIEYQVELTRPDGTSERVRLLGKLRARGVDTGTLQVVESLWCNGWDDRSSDGIGVPEPLGALPLLRIWLQRRVEGKPATALLEAEGGVQLASRIADTLHKLHGSGVPSRRSPHELADELRILGEALDAASAARPQWQARLERVRDASNTLAGGIESLPPAGIHRDFYADQLVVSGPRIFLVDLDLYCAGDRALDAGNFIAHLTEQSLRHFGDPRGLLSQEQAFRERFLELSGPRLRSSVQAYETLTLVRHIYISTRIPERREATEAILDLCEQRLDLARRPVSVAKPGAHSR